MCSGLIFPICDAGRKVQDMRLNTVDHGNKRLSLAIPALLVIFMLTAVRADEPVPRPDGWDRQSWQSQLLADRAERDRQFAASPASLLAAVEQVRHTSGASLAFDVTSTGIGRSPRPDPDAGIVLELSGQAWKWRPVDVAFTARYRGRPAEPGPFEPGLRIDLAGRFQLIVFAAEPDDLQFGVFDMRSPALQAFNGLVYFPPAEHYLVNAVLKKAAKAAIVNFTTARSGKRKFWKIGSVEFVLNGKSFSLTAFKERPEDNWLYLPFRDPTSGTETDANGRFLSIADPGEEPFLMDFNRATNSPCAYSTGFDCPQWPAENNLEVPIRAGEKSYPSIDGAG